MVQEITNRPSNSGIKRKQKTTTTETKFHAIIIMEKGKKDHSMNKSVLFNVLDDLDIEYKTRHFEC